MLAEIFDIEQERGIIEGKIFDIKITVLATLLFVANTVLSAYLAIATTRGVGALSRFGLREDVMGTLEYYVRTGARVRGARRSCSSRSTSSCPSGGFGGRRRCWPRCSPASCSRWREVRLHRITRVVQSGHLYTGTLDVIVIIVIWVYYAAVIFILGGEVGQVYELRRVRRLQRETFED